MKNYTMINGITFEVCNRNDELVPKCYGLYDAYERPSQAKIEIYDAWNNFFGHIYTLWSTHGIYSHNSNMFSICAQVIDEIGQHWQLYITKDHNRAWRIQ